MKKIFLLLIIISTCLASCDGRQVYHNNDKKEAIKFKKKNQFEQFVYHPESEAEVKIDTTMSNGYRVKLTAKTYEKDSIQQTHTDAVTTYKNIYRSFSTLAAIKKDNHTLFSKTIDFDYLSQLDYKFSIFRHEFIISKVEVNQYKSIENKGITLNVLLSDPINEKFKVFDLYIDENGKEFITEINT